jgi:multiple sugar transport system permease protein
VAGAGLGRAAAPGGHPLAAFIHNSFKRSRTCDRHLLLPFITSSVAIAMVFNTLFSRDYGQINVLLQWCASLPLVGGLFPLSPSTGWASLFIKPAVAFVIFGAPRAGTGAVLSALPVIPKDLYEAATIDGASKRQQFWHITLPQLRP